MYTQREASKIRQEFWTIFGKYMAPIASAEMVKVNWINYKTGEPQVSFKMDADAKKATLAIVFSHTDEGVRSLYYEQLMQVKAMLPVNEAFPWIFMPEAKDEYGRSVSKVFRELDGVNIFNREHWPDLMSFFKAGMIDLDEFWSMARYAFESLR